MTEADQLQLYKLQFRSRGSTTETRKNNAVCVRHAHKYYGFKTNPVHVLEDLNMTVPKGSIYGLLGASGCGKTTLINCIIGRKVLNSGEIWVLGGAPDTKGSGVPGPRIGFMPQQVSLHDEFTIRETMRYFGWIANMCTEAVEERLQFLGNLLQLPDFDQSVSTLSGGQQRRVSFAVALLHEPELLILDEPTVGLDPVLREVIWDHLLEITSSGSTTVILTTHYIDETKQANLIGLMRGGYIIAEESPQRLLLRCGTETLEDAFLKLSLVQNLNRHRRSSIVQEIASAVTIPTAIVNPSAILDDLDSDEIPEISGEFGDHISGGFGSRRASTLAVKDVPTLPPKEPKKTTCFDYFVNFNKNRIKALLWKNAMWFIRNAALLFTILLLPPFVVVMFFLAIGHNPQNLDIALINYETNNTPCSKMVSCNSTQLSCVYLAYLEDRGFNMVPYESEEEATKAVFTGRSYASITIRHNYTAALKSRIANYADTNSVDIDYSTIDVLRDVSVKDIATLIKINLYEGLQEFFTDYMDSCGESAEALSLPIRFKPPIYGVIHPEYYEYITPAVILTVTFFLALSLTAVVMIAERKEGILERSLVVGVNPMEILLSHVVVSSVLVTGQITLTLIVTFCGFELRVVGSLVLVVLLTMLIGFCGMCFGFAVSTAVASEQVATSIVTGLFLPISMISGLIWPIEGMHVILQKISIVLPFTKANESMRSILERGWDLTEPVVYYGFISVAIWTVIFLILTVLFLKFKKG